MEANAEHRTSQAVYFRPLVFGLCLLLYGCQLLAPQTDPRTFLMMRGVSVPETARFTACAGVDCVTQTVLVYSDEEWRRIATLFSSTDSSVSEREAVARAIALMETLVGAKNNTAGDLGRNSGWFASSPQLDCVAETINTTVALLMLEQRHLLKHHRVGYPLHRGVLHLVAPHYSAALIERQSGRVYAVDSWFFDNGQPPIIVPGSLWLEGYQPESL